MSIEALLILCVVVGAALYLVWAMIPMPPNFKRVLEILAIVFVVVIAIKLLFTLVIGGGGSFVITR